MPKTEALIPYLKQIDDSLIYSNFGPLHTQLVSRLAAYFEVAEDCIVLMSNATLALQGSLEILSQLASINSLVMPSWTFTASASAALKSNLDVEFADVDKDWRVLIEDSDNFVLDVLPFGETLRNSSLQTSNSRFQVIDGAASFDALVGSGVKLSERSILVVSMHATKLLGAGEGGICITPSPDIASALKAWSNFGFMGTRESQLIGTNSKLSEYNAAVGLASLDGWEETREILSKNLATAVEISKSCGYPTISSMGKGFVSPYWIIGCEDSSSRNNLERALNLSGIETRTWWGDGCHTMPAYQFVSRRDLSNTDFAASTSLGLPFHTYLSDSDFDRINDILNKFH